EMIRDSNGRKVTSEAPAREVSTDDRGVYRIYGLPAGTYLVVAGGPNDYSNTGIAPFETDVPTYAPSSTRDATPEISVRAGEEKTGVDIRYRGEPGRMVSGTASGTQVENTNFTVTLTSVGNADSQHSTETYQEPGREFVFNGIADGDYYVTAGSYVEN